MAQRGQARRARVSTTTCTHSRTARCEKIKKRERKYLIPTSAAFDAATAFASATDCASLNMMRQRPTTRSPPFPSSVPNNRPSSAPVPSSSRPPSVRRPSPLPAASHPSRAPAASSSKRSASSHTKKSSSSPTDLDLDVRKLSASLHDSRLEVSTLSTFVSNLSSDVLRAKSSDLESKESNRRLESQLLGLVGTSRLEVQRLVDEVREDGRSLRRSMEEGSLTVERRRDLVLRIEGEVSQTVVKTIEGRLDRELENLRINIRALGTEVERGGVMAMKAVQDVERRLFQQESKLFETEKECKSISRVVRSSAGTQLDEQRGDVDSRAASDALGGGYGGGGLYHRLSVMDFAMKGLVERMNNMEREMAAKDEKIAQLIKDNMKLMEEKGAELHK